jgi:MscS family membrane protein
VEVEIDFINQLFAGRKVDPFAGAIIIAVASIMAAGVLRYLGKKLALMLSRWSGLGISTQLFQIIRRPLWITVILIGLLVEVQWLAVPWPAGFWISDGAKTVLVIIWAVVLTRILNLAVSRLGGYYPNAAGVLSLVENIGLAAIAIIGFLIVLGVWHIDLTPILASAGLAGVIAALAAKDTLGNFFGGVSVFLDQPFQRGDYIVLSTGERGKVVDIGLRSTRIVTRDDILITIPNSVIVSTKIVNESAPFRRMRVRLKVSVPSPSDVEKVEEILLNAAHANKLVLSEPEPRVRFRSFSEPSQDFELLCWIAYPKDKGRLIHELNTAIFKAFGKAGLIFPMPQRDVYVHNVSDESSRKRGNYQYTATDDRADRFV